MPDTTAETRTPIMPCLAYRDAWKAIDWLCRTFGFEQVAAYKADDGSLVHAQLSFGNGMVMISSSDKKTPFGRWMAQPEEIGGRETQTIYVITQRLDDIHQRVQSSGADIIMALEEKEYGGSGFSCRDPEGHIWSFGTYDPRATHQ